MPIDLTATRLIVIEDRGRKYTFSIPPIPRERWLKYFAGIVSTSEMQGRTRVDSFDASAPRLELVEASLTAATGYSTEGSVPIESLPSWQSLLPLAHKLAVANTLISVEKSTTADEGDIFLGYETVSLDAVWGADEAGVMRKYHNLSHRFRTPTIEHQRRYSRDMSRSRVVGGSRTGRTQWMGAQSTLVEIYDELIVSVEGYCCYGHADAEQIKLTMDTYHKVAAAEQLFAPAEVKLEEEQ